MPISERTGLRITVRKAIRPAVILMLLSVIAWIGYSAIDMNGMSLDCEDREVRLIVTGSMDGEPTGYDIDTIPRFSLVVVKHLHQQDLLSLQEGDVIQFKWNGILNHHRILSVDHNNGYILTKGDSSQGTECVPFGDVTGIVIGCSPVLGKIVAFIKDHLPELIIGLVSSALVSELLLSVRILSRDAGSRR